jgi:ribosomal protein L29
MKKTYIQEIRSKTREELESLARDLASKRGALTRDLRSGKTAVLKEYTRAKKELALVLTLLNEKRA